MDHKIRRFVAVLVAWLALPASIAARAAPLDFSADALLGRATFTSATPLSGAASVGTPHSLAEDPVTGELWVSDEVGSRVLRFSSASAFTNGEAANLVLGQADFDGKQVNRGLAPSANSLAMPQGLAVDGAGRLFVADRVNNRILVFRPPYTNGMDAYEVLGQADFATAASNRGGATPTASTLSFPAGLAISPAGDLYVVDSNNRRLLRFPPPHGRGSVADGLLGATTFTATTTPALDAGGIGSPNAVAIGPDGSIWVSQENPGRVLRFPANAMETTRLPNLVLCQANFAATVDVLSSSGCSQVEGVAVDRAGTVYVSDKANDRVLVFSTLANGAVATGLVGQSLFTSDICPAPATTNALNLCQPTGLLVTRRGDLLVADWQNRRVMRYDIPRGRPLPTITRLSPTLVPVGGPAFTMTVNGTGFHTDSQVLWDGSARPTTFISATRLAASISAADIAGTNNHAVSVNTPAPGGGQSASVTLLVHFTSSFNAQADRVLGQSGYASSTAFHPDVGLDEVGGISAGNFAALGPGAVSVDARTGRLFVVDRVAHRVLSWPSASALHSAETADLVIGQPDFFANGCNSGGIGAATLCQPSAAVLDAAGGLFVSDTGNHRVLYFAPPLSSHMEATRVYGQLGAFTTRTANAATLPFSLNSPTGLAVSETWLFVYDSGNSRVLLFDPHDGDTQADRVIGQASTNTVQVFTPTLGSVSSGAGALALDAQGRLYVADSGFHRIMRFAPPFLAVAPATSPTAQIVLGQSFPSFSTPATTAAGLNTPVAIALDGAGNLAVADAGNHRVLRYTAPLGSGQAASHVLGQVNFTTATAGGALDKVTSPSGVAFDAAGNVYVGDRGNTRVLRFDTPWPALALATAALDFGGQSMGATTPPQPVVLTNVNSAATAVSAVTATGPFTATHDCVSLPALNSTCTVQVTFTPQLQGAATGTLTITSDLGTYTIALSGVGERSLVTHYYRSILRRAPDAPGKVFWESEATRMQSSGANVNEAWFAMAQAFYASAEYAAFNRDTNGFVTDLYTTFFNRAPDGPGLAFWAGQVGQGMPREVVLAAFMFSAEFTTFTQSIFGNTQVRREIDTVTDFYRGLLARLPDGGGFSFWVGQFRAAQCQGAAAVTAQAESISSSFATGGEYAGRGRSNAQYVGDLYNAFLRRGGDLAGVQFWITALNAATLTREQVRQQFVASAEFQARVQQVISQGCLP